MRSFLLPLMAVFGLPVPVAMAEQPVLIELFASQNCNACPKAHRTLRDVQAAHREDVLVLTWSVDYWDYLGTPDPMAIPAAMDRQSNYTDRFAIRAPYTPQSVYDGAMQCPATRRKAVETNISARLSAERPGRVDIVGLGPDRFSLDGQTLSPADVHLVEFLDASAHQTGMVNPIIRAQKLGTWTGGRVSFAYECARSCAVIVQKTGHGEVYAARQLN